MLFVLTGRGGVCGDKRVHCIPLVFWGHTFKHANLEVQAINIVKQREKEIATQWPETWGKNEFPLTVV